MRKLRWLNVDLTISEEKTWGFNYQNFWSFHTTIPLKKVAVFKGCHILVDVFAILSFLIKEDTPNIP
jgi:hypothetical protein